MAIGAFAAPPALAVPQTKQHVDNPLTIWIGDNGSFQELVAGNTDYSFFPRSSPNANAGFVLAFPTGQAAAYTTLEGEVWAWGEPGVGGPPVDGYFTALSQTNWTGSGTDADPYSQVTKYQVKPLAVALLEVEQTTTYVSGASNFVITYVIRELLGSQVKFRALVGADVYFNGSDCGSGVFNAGPPRFVGGSSLGRVGGFTEAAAPSPAWTHYFEGPYGGPPGACELNPTGSQGVWGYLDAAATGAGFPDTVDTSSLDNGVGIQWDTYYTSALPAGEPSVGFQLNTLGIVPGELSLTPSLQTVNAGGQPTLTATARDSSGTVAVGIPVRFTVSGANSAGGVVTTNGNGQAPISYTATKPGTDTVAAFEDLNGDGVQNQGEPGKTATVTVQASAPPPSSARDKTPPKLRLRAPRRMKLKKFLKGLSALVTVNEAARLEFRLLGSRKPPRGRRLKPNQLFKILLARQTLPASGSGTRAARLRPSRSKLKGQQKFVVKLQVTGTDRSGNRAVVTLTIRVK